MRPYERYQLDLIASEYRQKGYVVHLEESLPESRWRFDAIARNEVDGEMVLIELVNPNLSEEQINRRRLAIAEAALSFPKALVDFRYIDVKQSNFMQFNNTDENFRGWSFLDLMNSRVPPFNEHQKNTSRQMLTLWADYTVLLRGYGHLWRHPECETASIMDLYNSFLRAGILKPAEVVTDEVSDDLFQMYDVVTAATQGALVEVSYVKQLRGHYMWLRKQLKDHKSMNFYVKGIRW